MCHLHSGSAWIYLCVRRGIPGHNLSLAQTSLEISIGRDAWYPLTLETKGGMDLDTVELRENVAASFVYKTTDIFAVPVLLPKLDQGVITPAIEY